MQLSHYLCVALLLAAVPFRPAQDGKKPDETKPVKPPSAAQIEAERVQHDLLGSWRLVKYEGAGETFSGNSCRGVMLVVDGYMSIIGQFESSTVYVRNTTGELFSSSTYRWRYDPDRLLLLTTNMISIDNFTPNDNVRYEPPGNRRDYRIEFAGDSLTLAREGGGRLSFTRMAESDAKEPPPTKR